MVSVSRNGRFIGKTLKQSEDSITLPRGQMHEGVQHFIFDDEAITHESETCGL